jgi:UDP-glucose 4-epimerase
LAGLAGKTILVTGGAGFLGGHLCRHLCEAGSRVVATSRSRRESEIDGLEWLTPNLEDAEEVRRLLDGVRPEIIYHLAGEVSAAPDSSLVPPTFHSLLGSTVNVLMASLESGNPRVILAGSLTEPDDEQDRPVPSSPYAAAKWAASGYGRMFETLYGLPVVVLRPFLVYGPDQKAEKLVPYVIDSCLRGDAPKLSSGRQRGDWIYVKDVIEGMVAAASSESAVGQTLDLGTGQLVSMRELVDLIVELTDGGVQPSFGALPDRPLERPRVANLPWVEETLGWSPRTSLRDGLALTVESIRSNLE